MRDLRVLIVDPDAQVRSHLSLLLSMRGCRVETAENGQDALEVAEELHPSLVLLDMQTPGLEGRVFVRELRARHADAPLIVMGPEREVQRWAVAVGAVGYLPKPVQVSRLLSCVQIPDRSPSTNAA